jgi:hypothetical protein
MYVYIKFIFNYITYIHTYIHMHIQAISKCHFLRVRIYSTFKYVI